MIQMGIVMLDNYHVIIETRNEQMYPEHLKNSRWAFKPAAPFVLDIVDYRTPSYSRHPMLTWFHANNVKRLAVDDKMKRWSTWLFPSLEVKTLWLLQHEEEWFK